jgi:hypothetical protein
MKLSKAILSVLLGAVAASADRNFEPERKGFRGTRFLPADGAAAQKPPGAKGDGSRAGGGPSFEDQGPGGSVTEVVSNSGGDIRTFCVGFQGWCMSSPHILDEMRNIPQGDLAATTKFCSRYCFPPLNDLLPDREFPDYLAPGYPNVPVPQDPSVTITGASGAADNPEAGGPQAGATESENTESNEEATLDASSEDVPDADIASKSQDDSHGHRRRLRA